MADIHPDIRGLLNTLSASGFTQLVQLCVEQISRKEQSTVTDGSDLTPAARRRALREQRRLRGQNQLSILDDVVRGALEEERKLITGLRVSAETLAIKNVALLPSATFVESPGAQRNFEQLLSHDREAAIDRFLFAWSEVMSDARTRLGVS